MILFTILTIMLLLLIILVILAVSIGGVVGLVIGGDLIICIWLIAKVLIKKIRKFKNKKG